MPEAENREKICSTAHLTCVLDSKEREMRVGSLRSVGRLAGEGNQYAWTRPPAETWADTRVDTKRREHRSWRDSYSQARAEPQK
eukprot:3940770-Rhodomonas_salina.3